MLRNCLCLVLAMSVFLLGGTVLPVSIAVSNYDDEFDSSVLDEKWTWIRENSNNWSLTESPGSMRIVVEAGDLNHNPADNKNMLLQDAPEGDWEITTKLTGKPSANWAQAGLIVYQDDNNYLKLVRLYNNANQFQLAKEVGGVWSENLKTDTIAGTVSYLRIKKSGNSYSGYYSEDGINWVQVGSPQTLNISNIKIGLMACNGCASGGPTMNADFDYFRVTLSEQEPAPSGNLALNKPAIASSIQGAGYEAGKAVDGNINTRWSADFTGDPQWIYVDLGATYTISRVVLRWETAYAKAYQIQVSDDATNWVDVYSTTSGDGGIDDISFTPTSGRYVRVYGTQRGTQYSYSLWEFEVYGESEEQEPAPPPSDFWLSGGSRNTNYQSSTYEWANFRGRPCTFQVVYSTRNAGWDAFISSHGTSGQIASFTDPSITVMIQTPPFPEGGTYSALINGDYDQYWQQIGALIKNRVDSGLPTIISIGWEMNGAYMYWGGGTGTGKYANPEQFIAGYRRIVQNLRKTYPEIETAWIINAHATPPECGTTDAWDFYPGDDVVTYVGIDNYDHYPPAPDKATFDAIANANGGLYWLANHARQHGKQIIVGEWGIAPGSGSNGGGDNPVFIECMFETFLAWHNEGLLKAEFYFADPIGGGNVDSDLIGGNPLSREKYISLYKEK